jgi:hypothetical protein
MKNVRFLLVAAALTPLVGCEWMKRMSSHDDKPKGDGPILKVQPDQLVTYLNERSSRLESLNYGDVRLVASDHSVPLPALRGSMVAAQPRNFRMTGTGGAMGAKVDLGSNDQQFWIYFDAPTVKPMFVFASHTDFDSGRAKLPGGIPFEPDWVMQALGMTVLPPSNQYTAKTDEKARTYTLSWQSAMPSGVPVVKEIVFDVDAATGNKPQVKRHLIKDTKGKLICSAEIKQARTVQLTATDPRTGLPLAVQHPTLMVLKWEQEKFEMELELKSGKVNDPPTDEAARRLFSRPSMGNATAVDLAHARYDSPGK